MNYFVQLKRRIERAGSSKVYVTIDLDKARVGRTRKLENEETNPHWSDVSISTVPTRLLMLYSLSNKKILLEQLSLEELNYQSRNSWKEKWIDGLSSSIMIALPYMEALNYMSNYNFLMLLENVTGLEALQAQNFQEFLTHSSLREKAAEFYFTKMPISQTNSSQKSPFLGASWSVYTKITLVRYSRGQKPGEHATLGELFNKKTSTLGELLKKKASEVKSTVSYAPRDPDNGLSIVQDIEISTMFTHHQKIVVVDSEMPNRGSERRRIVSFIGGIDLCDGRYDTPTHTIFRTLDTVNHDDFRQPNFPNASITKGGPRQPWHDVHCRLEGAIAWDVLFNFEQRWRKQGGKDLLVQLRELDDIIIPPSPVMFPEDHETWNVQLFRSIDGGAAFGFPDSPEDAARAGLICGSDHIIDRSIQDAYIHAIRKAKNFIYIENQYFLGSSFCWNSDGLKVEDIGASHLIPKELSLKVVSKIETGERFSIYVVVPMWPEGPPRQGAQGNPKDYLTFFCLGNRESKTIGEYEPPESPDHDTDYYRAQQSRRFMIYVHAKMMIVDDEYIVIGSANINQRSMDGARDSEIAMGGYQPYHLATKQPARGQIHGFRMALWYEHLGLVDNSFLQPESLDCIQKVNKIAERNWNLYSSERMDDDLPGHLLSYPICVTDTGEVKEVPGSEFFPDTKAQVLGSKSDYLPPILTT
ncbi:Phospholipase D alpha 1 [Vitis vinifera]|uniref:phospholipase D n=1 Tax=Vitis vinifera TaxID=29760 RepID=A0A438JQ46_VITVI|nr:Phospholipase D alpha 1 [Vitis vinifera]